MRPGRSCKSANSYEICAREGEQGIHGTNKRGLGRAYASHAAGEWTRGITSSIVALKLVK
eukprot:216332-Pleurochrysis_carterae.AAC.1